ncbi:hypothetical protein [Candidatus Lokiarchaeum ossiferum]|uniref:hypothetical protein n=1 Tax=Candidatus Lokiarchaeum ossiferum TaxID=2951803 RepID=UPI00352DECB5
MVLSNRRLRRILSEIYPSQNQRNFFHSKWLRIINFLYNSTGFSISKVGIGGSQGKKTEIYKSDFDIIFACSDIYDRQERFDELFDLLQDNFRNATNNIIQKTRAVYVEFPNDFSYDVVLLTSHDFDQEMRRLQNFRQSDDKMLNTIRLCKYVCSQISQCGLQSYEIEQKVEKLYNADSDLADNTYRTLQSMSATTNIPVHELLDVLQ